MKAGALWLLLLAGCPAEKTRTTDTRSRTLPTAKERTAFLCGYLVCPTTPSDAAFHVMFQDNSGGMVPGPSDFTIRAMVKVTPDETELWVRGCTQAQLEARPAWVGDLLAERPGWAPKSAPDTYSCGLGRTRLVHVKEGVVLVEIVSN